MSSSRAVTSTVKTRDTMRAQNATARRATGAMASCRVRGEVLEHGTVVPASMLCPEIDGVKALEVRLMRV